MKSTNRRKFLKGTVAASASALAAPYIGWKTAAKKPVKNQDLWQLLDAAVEQRNVSWFWVKGHSGHPDNEAVDEGANLAIDALLAAR